MGLYPLFLTFKIFYYERALKELQHKDANHPDVPDIVRRLRELYDEQRAGETAQKEK